MRKIRLYWAFYKSTLATSILVAFACAFLNIAIFWYLLSVGFMTCGTFLSLLYKNLVRHNEYYFYNNCGISKYQLIAFTITINVLIGISILIIKSYVTLS